MSTPETIVSVVLWVIAASVLLLLLLLYRQVDRAYGSSDAGQATALLPGVELPPVEVMTSTGPGFLELPEGPEPSILAFIGTDCDRCSRLVETLREESVFDGPATCLFVDATPDGEAVRQAPDNSEKMRFFSAAYAPDIPRAFGVNSVPLVYVLDGKTVLAARSAADRPELEELLGAAHRQQEDLAAEAARPAGG